MAVIHYCLLQKIKFDRICNSQFISRKLCDHSAIIPMPDSNAASEDVNAKQFSESEPNHLSTGGEVDLKSRVDTSSLLAGARSLGAAAAGASSAGELVLGNGALTGALASGARA